MCGGSHSSPGRAWHQASGPGCVGSGPDRAGLQGCHVEPRRCSVEQGTGHLHCETNKKPVSHHPRLRHTLEVGARPRKRIAGERTEIVTHRIYRFFFFNSSGKEEEEREMR